MAVVQTPVMHRGVIFFLAVFCWLLTGTASHALTRPPVAAPFISHEEQLKEESRWQDGPALTEGVAICYEMQSGLFVGNDPINYVDPDGVAAIFINYQGGGTYTIDNPSISALKDALNLSAKSSKPGNKISELTIKGHANSELIKFNWNERLTATEDGTVYLDDKRKDDSEDITDLLRKALAPNAFLNLLGCSTGRGKGNLSQNVSKALPSVTVIGSASFTQMNRPFKPNTIGWKAVYQNGERQFRMYTK